MRIAILTNAFPPDGQGGAERTAFIQADTLACLGHDVRVWAPDRGAGGRGPQAGSQRTVVHGMEVIRFASLFSQLKNMSRLQRFGFHLVTDAAARKDVVKQIVDWKPDVLLTHNLTGCGMATPRTIQRQGIRWMHTLHDIQLTDPSGQESLAFSKTISAGVWRWLWSFRRRLSFGTPDVLISPTQWLLDWHQHQGFKIKQTAVIPNPVDVQPARERELQHPASIAYIGRLSNDKGFGMFLDVIQQLDASLVNKIVVVGGGSMMTQAERLLDKRLLLRGALSFEDARRVIGESDLLIAPSQILENQQTVLLEAMAEGTPVVATDVGGTRETLKGTGCPVVEPSGLIDAVRHVLSDVAHWKQLSDAMRKRAEERHDKEKYFETLMRLF
jgi:glycosyltransferase involved in cell wall biosynthesis